MKGEQYQDNCFLPARDKRLYAFASSFSFLSDSRTKSEGLTVECDTLRLAQIGLSWSFSVGNTLYFGFIDWWRVVFVLVGYSSSFVKMVLERFRVDFTFPKIGSYSTSTSTISCAEIQNRIFSESKKKACFQWQKNHPLSSGFSIFVSSWILDRTQLSTKPWMFCSRDDFRGWFWLP